MQRTFIGDIGKESGKTALINGMVITRRDHGKLVVLEVRDLSGSIQVVVSGKQESAYAAVSSLREQSSVEIVGSVRERPESQRVAGENGHLELSAESVTVLSASNELPFELSADLNIDTYLDNLPFTLRSSRARDIFRVQEAIIDEFRAALKAERFTEFQAPALVGGDAEGGAAAFAVDYYYNKKAYLATSPQFYKQIMVGVYERAFATPKVFRGEKHATTRHLSEYSSLDFEMGFIKDHRDVMAVLEEAVRRIVLRMDASFASLFERMGVALPLLPEKIPVLKLREAQAILESDFGQAGATGEPDLEPEHERQLCEWSKKEHGSDFLFVTHYPVSKRPFYVYEDEEDPGFTKSFDLLFKGLEISTGGQRIHDHDTLVSRMKLKNLDPALFSYYLQAFKVGMPPHGGCALGLARVTARMLDLANVKEATLFPRDINRIDTRLAE